MVSLFATAAPGLEAVLAAEVAALPAAVEVTALPGGVAFSGPTDLVGQANLLLRSAGRVLLRLARFQATRPAQIGEAAAAVPWERYLRHPGVQPRVSSQRCRVYHSGAAAEQITRALAQRLRPAGGDEGEPAMLLLRGVSDQWELSIDTSGPLLHQRGYRLEAGEAPLRETLAAALLLLAGYAGGPLLDLCCGSATFPIEAAWIQRRIPPGLLRRFAFEDWPVHEASSWQTSRQQALARVRPQRDDLPPIEGIDIDEAVLQRAGRNAQRAGVRVTLRRCDLFQVKAAPAAGALVVANPPYGRRLGGRREQQDLIRRLGFHLQAHFGDHPLLLLCGGSTVRLPQLTQVSLQTGGLPLTVLHGRAGRALTPAAPPPAAS